MTQRSLLVLGIALGLGATAAAQQGASIDPALMAAKNKFINAYKTCNMADLNAGVTEDMLFIHASGEYQDKKVFADHVGTCFLSDLRFDPDTVRTLGDVAILSGPLTFKTKQGMGMTFVVSEAYVKRGGKWLFAWHQSTDANGFKAAMAAAAKKQ